MFFLKFDMVSEGHEPSRDDIIDGVFFLDVGDSLRETAVRET